MYPPFLQPNDTIGIVATARWVTAEQLQPAIALFQSWGFRVKVAPAVFEKNFQLAGNDAVRLAALQQMLDDPEIKAVVIARGGYGTVRVVDAIDWTAFLKHPKWVCGYSDITVLLNVLTNKGFGAIHSTMPISFPDATPEALEQLRRCLVGEKVPIVWEGSGQKGNAEGPVVGGNLSVIYSQLGSATQLDTRGKILFLEDVDEMLYHIDRMLVGLKRAGLFEGCTGVVFGGFTQMKDNTASYGFSVENPWGFSVEEMAMEYLGGLHIPIGFGFPAGHLNDNRAFYQGCLAQLEVRESSSTLFFL
jgi:muramoyltetrapeptide carboxypeptidase